MSAKILPFKPKQRVIDLQRSQMLPCKFQLTYKQFRELMELVMDKQKTVMEILPELQKLLNK